MSTSHRKTIGKFLVGPICILASGAVLADLFSCNGDLTRIRTEDPNKGQIGPKPCNNAYELEISNWGKNTLKVTESINGKRFSGSFPATIKDGIYTVDHTEKNGQVMGTTKIKFNIHSKGASIVSVMTRGNVSMESTLNGFCR